MLDLKDCNHYIRADSEVSVIVKRGSLKCLALMHHVSKLGHIKAKTASLMICLYNR